ncbi:zinc finger protein 99-like [Uranotaenia lowii]|uniref:zinc finger protein 99-like n=1 Tax=Uranotaenia lowii TaxID=190385 RepID=UPI00247A8F46|nr:zinc finger protein 99-like [Uranotaenia lowii]XP_055612025.1 zinc finger protein 99-like [Uranotaenia lowii]
MSSLLITIKDEPVEDDGLMEEIPGSYDSITIKEEDAWKQNLYNMDSEDSGENEPDESSTASGTKSSTNNTDQVDSKESDRPDYMKRKQTVKMKIKVNKDAGETFECDICKLEIKKKFRTRHLKSHKYPVCQFCNKKFVRERNLALHQATFHGYLSDEWAKKNYKKWPHRCDRCSLHFRCVEFIWCHKCKGTDVSNFDCKLCNVKLDTEDKLTKHVAQKHKIEEELQDKLKYKCLKCDKIFSNKRLFEKHKQKCVNDFAEITESQSSVDPDIGASPQRRFQCLECGKKFLKYCHLNRHQATVHLKSDKINEAKGGVQCIECGKKFRKNYNLNRHRQAVHMGIKPFACTECEMSFTDKRSLERHFGIVHVAKPRHECEFCGKKFFDGTSYSYHRKRKHPKERAELMEKLGGQPLPYRTLYSLDGCKLVTEFECPDCSKEFEDEEKLALHKPECPKALPLFQNNIKEEHKEDERPMDEIPGSYDSIIIKEENDWNQVLYHKDAAYFSENEPKQSSPAALMNSSKSNMDQADLEESEKDKYTNSDSLGKEDASEIVESNASGFDCMLCNVKFDSEDKLTMHVAQNHQIEKNLDSGNLKTDIIKTNEKRFKCTVCGSTFRKIYNLNRHGLAVHMNFRPYSCTECQQKFSDKRSLERHFASQHVGKPRHECEFCGRKFYDPNTYHLHRKRKHPKERAELMKKLGAKALPYRTLYLLDGCKVVTEFERPNEARLTMQVTQEQQGNVQDNLKDDSEISVPNVLDFECKLCKVKFESEDKLAMHVAQKHQFEETLENATFKCLKCDEICCDKSLFKKHQHNCVKYLTNHNENQMSAKADMTNDTQKMIQSLECQVTAHLKSDKATAVKYKCIECGKKFRRYFNLRRHRLSVHLKIRPFPCTECQMTFTNKRSLERHFGSLHVSMPRYECEFCGQKFYSSTAYHDHRMQVHPKERVDLLEKTGGQSLPYRTLYSLDGCKLVTLSESPDDSNFNYAAFDIEDQQTVQMAQKPQIEEKPQRNLADASETSENDGSNFDCKLCNAKFVCEKKLSLHVAQMHLVDGKFEDNSKCFKCGKIFSRERLFETHMKKCARYFEMMENSNEIYSSADSDIECLECGKKFPTQTDLHEHQTAVHSKTGLVRQFNCTDCGKHFGKIYNLNRHRRAVHLNIRPFPCTKCQFKFTDKRSLERHFACIHVGKPRYECEFCGMQFYESTSYLKHRNQKHPKERAKLMKSLGVRTLPYRTLYSLDGCKLVAEFKCPDCSEQFADDEKLADHKQECTKSVKRFLLNS